MILAHRIRLDPTQAQIIEFKKACGCRRKAWNWGLAEWVRQYEAGEKPNWRKVQADWNKIKRKQFPYIYDSPKDANQRPFVDLGNAWGRYFKGLGGKPRFKCKNDHDSFYISNDRLEIGEFEVKLPRIGKVRTLENLRFYGVVTHGTVVREAGNWFICVSIDVGDLKNHRVSDNQIGIDLGLKTTIVTSDGETFEAPKPLKANLKKLKRLQKQLSRKQKGSKNREKAQRKLAKLHSRIANIRKDWTHKMTTKLCRENQTICLEDLKVKNMMKNHCLAGDISDVSWYEIRRQIEYKARTYNGKVAIINQWLPTSKTCSNCGCKKEELSLKDRVFHCSECGFVLDRDHNAALNILAAGLAVLARGPESSDDKDELVVKLYRDEAGTREELTSVSSN